MSTDDWRGVEWARQQVERIDGLVAGLSTAVAELQSVIGLSREVTNAEESFQQWTARHVEKLSDAVTRLERDLAGSEKALSALNDRVSQLESRLNAYGVPEVRGEYKINPNLPEGYAVAGDFDFSPPIGGRERARDLSEYREHILDVDRTRVKAIEEQAIIEAVARVRAYMAGHFSEATIGGVVRALEGKKMPYVTIKRDEDQGVIGSSTEVREG